MMSDADILRDHILLTCFDTVLQKRDACQEAQNFHFCRTKSTRAGCLAKFPFIGLADLQDMPHFAMFLLQFLVPHILE